MSKIIIPKTACRRGNVFDAFALPSGVMVIRGATKKYLETHPLQRELVEKAQRMLSDKNNRKVEFGILTNEKKLTANENRIINKNAVAAGNIIQGRAKEENLTQTKVTNEKVKNLIY